MVDLTRLLPGPMATKILADLGARVIKVESLTAPDLLRFAPPLKDGVNPVFSHLNSGKESMVLDLKSERDLSILHEVAHRSDILVTSSRKNWLERTGLVYHLLSQRSPHLICCNLSAFRREDKAGHDINSLAVSGLASLLGDSRESPTLPGTQFADVASALQMVIKILAALHARSEDREGTQIEVSMEESCEPFTLAAGALADSENTFLERLCGESPFYRFYRCKDDRYIALGAVENKFQRRLRELLPTDTHGWPQDLFWGEGLKPVHHQLEELFGSRTQAQWEQFFDGENVCFSPVLPLHVKQTDGLSEELGGSTARILAELGYSESQRDEPASLE